MAENSNPFAPEETSDACSREEPCDALGWCKRHACMCGESDCEDCNPGWNTERDAYPDFVEIRSYGE